MYFSPPNRPYATFLLVNGGMAMGFVLLYFTGYALENMGLLLFSLLFAGACLPVELLLGLAAAIRDRWWLAVLYGLVSLALFFCDRWAARAN